MTTERQPVPDVLLERYLAGDLGAEDRQRIEAACQAHPELRARLEELAAERSRFLAANPPVDFARQVAGRLELEYEARAAATRTAPRWLAWVLAPSAAAAVALVATLTVTRMSSDEMAPVLVEPPPGAVPALPPATPAEAADELSGGKAGEVVEAPPRKPEARGKKVRASSKRKSARRFLEEDNRRGRGAGQKPKRRRAGPPAPQPTATPPPQAPALAAPAPMPPAPPPEPPAKTADLDEVATSEAESLAPRSAAESKPRSRTTAEVRQIVARRKRQLKSCLRAGDEVAAGSYTLEIAWEITPAGDVENLRWLKPKHLAETNLARCVLDRIRAWAFPVADSPTTIDRLPLTVKVE